MKKLLQQWEGHIFESSTGLTEEYATFNKSFKRVIKRIATNLGGTITGFKPNHFCTSGFISVGDKHLYISISDVRHYQDSWINHILIRTANSVTDYTGGSNHFIDLENLESKAKELLNK